MATTKTRSWYRIDINYATTLRNFFYIPTYIIDIMDRYCYYVSTLYIPSINSLVLPDNMKKYIYLYRILTSINIDRAMKRVYCTKIHESIDIDDEYAINKIRTIYDKIYEGIEVDNDGDDIIKLIETYIKSNSRIYDTILARYYKVSTGESELNFDDNNYIDDDPLLFRLL